MAFIDNRLLIGKGIAAGLEFIAGGIAAEGAPKATLLRRKISKLVKLPRNQAEIFVVAPQ